MGQQHLSNAPDLFFSSAKEQTRVEELQHDVKLMVQNCFPETEKLAELIESRGLPVISNMPELQLKLAMMLVGIRPGFVSAGHPRYAEFVETILKHLPHKAHLDFSKGMLLTLKENYHFSVLCYELYHWEASVAGLPGYRDVDRKNYYEMNVLCDGLPSDRFLQRLDLNQANGLRQAIRRDREALQFARKILHEVFIPANNAKLLESGDAQA